VRVPIAAQRGVERERGEERGPVERSARLVGVVTVRERERRADAHGSAAARSQDERDVLVLVRRAVDRAALLARARFELERVRPAPGKIDRYPAHPAACVGHAEGADVVRRDELRDEIVALRRDVHVRAEPRVAGPRCGAAERDELRRRAGDVERRTRGDDEALSVVVPRLRGESGERASPAAAEITIGRTRVVRAIEQPRVDDAAERTISIMQRVDRRREREGTGRVRGKERRRIAAVGAAIKR
jgi:hypothetical protein